MIEEKRNAMRHNIIIEERKNAVISGVAEVDSFDEEKIVLFLSDCVLTVRGRGMHITKLSIETGDVNITGDIYTVEYSGDDERKSGGLISRIFR